MKQFILSPCGTSLLTNQANSEERKLISNYANYKKSEDVTVEDRQVLISLIKTVTDKFATADINLAVKLTAELNGIIHYYNNCLQPNGDYLVLLCTDTWLGESTAIIIKDWLTQKGFIVEVKRQQDLRTVNLIEFQSALSDIVKWCEETVSGYQKSGYHIVFNLTGGFKSVQGFLQTLAMFYANETIYIFETATELLRIPRLPIEMAANAIVKNNLMIFRRLSMNLDIAGLDITKIPETLLLSIDNKFALSPWGEIVWQKSKKEIYQKQFYSSPSDKITWGDNFTNNVNELSPDRKITVNEKIDLLARCLEIKIGCVLQALDFKPLQGNPCPPSTHEIDAWHDQDAKRIFGHYEGEIFILDKLDKALH
jgi:putative CRISPR-associated protein (TIGR02619 family)